MESSKTFLTASVMSWMVEEDHKSCEDLWGTRCPACQIGVLHWGSWVSKGGIGEDIDPPEGFRLRFSLCCSNRNCRKRCTPASIRFPPKGKAATAVLLMVKLMRAQGSERRRQDIAEHFGVSLSTVGRWLCRWRSFAARNTRWRQEIAARFQLGGGELEALWSKLQSLGKGIVVAFYLLLRQCHSLWHEWRCRR